MTATLKTLDREFKHPSHVNYRYLLMVFLIQFAIFVVVYITGGGVLINFCAFLSISLGDSGSYIILLF